MFIFKRQSGRQRSQRHLVLEDARPRVSRWWLCLRYLLLLLASVLLGLLLFAVSTVDAGELDNVHAGELLLQAQDTGTYSLAVQLGSEVHFQVSGLVAKVALQQRFRNDSDQWVEAVYVFPLPDTAAVNRLRLQIGERVIVGAIKERAAARAIYRQALTEGKKAGLVEQQRPNLFTSRVANIGPGETVQVELQYVQRVRFNSNLFSLRFPMTITPRYIPGQPLPEAANAALDISPTHGWALATDQVPDAASITPPLHPPVATAAAPVNPIAISADIDMGIPLASLEALHHDMQLTRSGQRYHLQLAQPVVPMDRDFVLQWRPVTGSEPRAALFQETVAGEDYALLLVIPPALGTAAVMPREVVFVIDTSGSMGGSSIDQARASLQLALAQLGPRDQFNIVEFNSRARALFPTSVPADAHALARAGEFVRHLDAGGGTEMLAALQLALGGAADSDLLRQVVFITDGAVGNEQALLQEIQRNIGSSRLFTVGIGSAPNSWFMRKAAQFGRGQFTFISDLDQVQDKMLSLFDSLSQPLASHFSIDWPRQAEVYPQRIPDLYRGEPLLVAARLAPAAPAAGAVSAALTGPAAVVRVSGRIAGKHWRRSISLPGPGQAASAHAGVATVWARQKIDSLLDQLLLGTAEPDVRDQVLPVALTHELLSPYTSFVAVEQVVSRPADTTAVSKAVANVRPAGQSAQPFAYPKTATGAMANLLAGLLLLCSAALLALLRRAHSCYCAY